MGARLLVWLWQSLEASPLAPLVHSSFPRAENIKVDTLATKPWAWVELGAEITMAKFCLMPGCSSPKGAVFLRQWLEKAWGPTYMKVSQLSKL